MSEVNPRDFSAPEGLGYLNDKPSDRMRTMEDMLRDPENGNGYVMPGDIKRGIGSGGSLGFPAGKESWIGAPTHYTAYVVKAGAKERYAKTKEKALQIAAEMLDCDGKVEIKRIELS